MYANFEGQEHFIVITEIHQRTIRNTLGVRPGKISDSHSFGRLPVNRRCIARITRIDPISVPTIIDGLTKQHGKRRARCHAVNLGHQVDEDVRNICPADEGCQQQEQQQAPLSHGRIPQVTGPFNSSNNG